MIWRCAEKLLAKIPIISFVAKVRESSFEGSDCFFCFGHEPSFSLFRRVIYIGFPLKVYICPIVLRKEKTFDTPMSLNLKEFNRFFTDYQQRFVHFACTYVHDEAMAEDFVIESMMYYWENRDRLPADTNVPAYVLTAIKHRCIDYLRSLQLRNEVSDELSRLAAWELSTRLVSLEEFEPGEVFTQEIQDIVDATLNTLSEQTRSVFIMSRYENKSHKEIAELLGISVKGVEFHISKAIKMLRVALKDYLSASLLLFLFH